MSDASFLWGHEHFCEPDARRLYDSEPQRIHNPDIGFPVPLDEPPETFCSVCLQWWTAPEEGVGTPTPLPETKEHDE